MEPRTNTGSRKAASHAGSRRAPLQLELSGESPFTKIDILGTDTMPMCTIYTFKDGTTVEVKPTGKKCRTCPLKDNDWCPVAVKVRNTRCYVQWEKPPNKISGIPEGTHCIFCYKLYTGKIKRSRIPSITMNEYEQILGAGGDEQALMKHQAMSVIEIKKICDSGGNFNAHIDWTDVETQSLTLKYKRSLNTKTPAFKHYPTMDYEEDFGPLATNGMLLKGHRIWAIDGVPGVLVPQRRITDIEMNSEMAALMSSEVSSTENGSSTADLATLQESIAGSFWNESSGGVHGAVSRMLTDGSADVTDVAAPTGASSSGSGFDLSAMIGSSASGVEQAVLGDSTVEAPLLAANRRTAKIQKPKQRSRQSSPDIAPQPSPVKPERQEGRGRPKREWTSEIVKLADEFSASTETDPLWWGSESKTLIKDMGAKLKDLKQRVRNCSDLSECESLQIVHKQLVAMIAIVSVAATSGLGSEEFKGVYDLQESTLALPPSASLRMPKHVKWHRHQMDIGQTDTSSRWLERTSSTQLRENGVADVLGEQMLLWSERLATNLKLTDKSRMLKLIKEVFSMDLEYELEDRAYL